MEMLRQCQKKTRPYEQTSMLVQANAEVLPFADRVFDVAFHVGGINLFDRPAQAVREMVRVARPGALILIADESPRVVRDHYQRRNPFTRAATRGISTDLDPREWVPPDVRDLSFAEVWGGKGYFLSFRAPG
jgi:ubiquinone/menaquinone biosynthesis C-methylase UbiE